MSNSLDQFIKIVEDGQEKTSSNKNSEVTSSLLDKLAAELGASESEDESKNDSNSMDMGDAGADAQGGVKPAATPITEANPAVTKATDAVAVPQEVASGSNPAEKPAGEVKKPAKSGGPIISSDASDAQDANTISKEEASVAEDISKESADIQYGHQVGKAMADAFYGEMEKRSFDEQYQQARSILDEAGLLKNYNFS